MRKGATLMRIYKAIVKEKDTGIYVAVESSYNTKTDFINDLRRNGYAVNPAKVKLRGELNRIMNTTNANKWDFESKKRRKNNGY